MMTHRMVGFADELTKTADIAKLLNVLSTPIKGTPKLLMKVRGKAERAAIETARREKLRDVVNGNIYKGLKKLRIDKIYQKLEPALGSQTEPAAMRAMFGDRKIYAMAQRPIHELISYAPVPYASSIHNLVTAGAQKLLKIPGPRAYPGLSPATAAAPKAAVETAKAVASKPTKQQNDTYARHFAAMNSGRKPEGR